MKKKLELIRGTKYSKTNVSKGKRNPLSNHTYFISVKR